MQDCFRQHPDIYGTELDEEEVDVQLNEQIASDENKSAQPTDAASSPKEESEELVPKASHDAREKEAAKSSAK